MPVSILPAMPRTLSRDRLSDNGTRGLDAVEVLRAKVLGIHFVVVGLAADADVFVAKGLDSRGETFRGFSSFAAARFGDVCVVRG